MMRKINLIFLLFFCTTSVWAQLDVPLEEDKAKEKEIIEMKKTGDFFYSDVRLDANAGAEALSEAEKESLDKLRVHVVEIFGKRLGMSKKNVQEIWDVIESRCKHVVVRNGDMFRIFSYVMKTQLDPNYVPKGPRKTTRTKTQEVPQPEKPVSVNAEVKSDTVTVVAETQPEQTTVVAEVDTIAVAVADKKVEEQAESKQSEGTPLVKILPAEKVQPVVVEEPAKVAPAPEVVVPELCRKVIEINAWNGVRKFLKEEQARGTLMSGGKTQMQYHEKCYIAVFEKSSLTLVALYDKGGSERMNFVSKQMEAYERYMKPKSGYLALFIQEY